MRRSAPSPALLLCIISLEAAPALAQSGDRGESKDPPLSIRLGDHVLLRPRLQYRPRFLVHEGRDFRPGGTSATLRHRARLGLQADFWSWLSAYIELQDARIWGSETDTLLDYDANGFDLHQGWVEARTCCGFQFRVGRQEVNWDNQRLIGAVGWSEQGRALDAIRIRFIRDRVVKAEALYAMVMDEEAFLSGADASSFGDVHLAGVRARSEWHPAAQPTVLMIYDRINLREQNRFTLGAFVDGKPVKGLEYSAEFFYQLGDQRVNGVDRDIAAFMGAARLGYTLPVKTSPGLGAWFEYLSGDDGPNDNTIRTFDTLYATNHKFYGFMDFFLNIPLHTDGLGLMDIGGRVSVKPLKGLLLFVDFHHFEQAVTDPQWGTTTYGQEVDFLARYVMNRYLAFEGVFAFFVPKLGAAIRRMDKETYELGKQTELYGYVQINVQL
jgi:hypothetical protein